MRTESQESIDCSYEMAVKHKCDTIQLKMDGWWSRTHLSAGTARVFSRTQREILTYPYDPTAVPELLLVGEYMHGTQWAQHPSRKGRFVLFDCWFHNEYGDLTGFAYRDRYALLASLHRSGVLPERMDIIKNYPIQAFDELWRTEVVEGGHEGVVYRRRTDAVGAAIYRQKHVFTVDLFATGFVEGEGKHSGRLGAIVGRGETEVLVGGGFSDEQRAEIWTNQSSYLGKVFEVRANKEFESGSLRHPQFVRWRGDKVL